MQPNRLIYFVNTKTSDQQNSLEGEDGKEKQEEEARRKEELIDQALGVVDRLPPTLQKQQRKWTTREQLQSLSNEELKSLIDYFQKSEAVGQQVELTFQMGRALQQDSKTSEFVKKKLDAFFQKYEAGQTTEKENTDFSKFVEHAVKNLPEREQSATEFAALSASPGAESAVAKVKLDSGGGKTVEGLISKDEFGKLPTEVQKKYLTQLKESYKRRVENHHPDIVAKNEELQKRDDIPKDYKTWLSDKTTNETLKDKTDWVVLHIPELQNLQNQFEQKSGDSIVQKVFQKKGEPILSLKGFQELTRDERTKELQKLDDERAKYEQEFGLKKEAGEAADQQTVETGTIGMKDSAEAAEKAEADKLKNILEQLKVSTLHKRTQQLYGEKLAHADDSATREANSIANLRARAQENQGGFFQNVGQMLGFGKSEKKAEALENKELREQSARRSASAEVIQGKEEQDEFKKIVGITPDKELKPGELEKFAGAFLSAKNLEDPREIKNALLSNEELRQLALRVANLDVQKMAA